MQNFQVTPAVLAIVTHHYLIAAEWADKDEGTNPRFTREAKAQALTDCTEFVKASGGLFAQAMAIPEYGYAARCDGTPASEACAAAFGHDFWLTRRGHGAGFSDRTALRVPRIDTAAQGIDRDGKPYPLDESLGDALDLLAYGGNRFSRFEGCELLQYCGWLSFS